MAISNVVTKYRPLKIGFLVREGQLEDVFQVVKINSFLIGGIHNIIIPVADSIDKIKDIISESDIDVLYAVANSSSICELIGEFPFLRVPSNFSNELFREDWITKKHTFLYLDVFNLIERQIEKYFRGTSTRKKSNAAYIKWETTDPLEKWFLLAFGSYNAPELKLHKPFENAFIAGLRAHEFNLVSTSPIPRDISGKITPNLYSISELRSHSNNDSGFYIGQEDNFQDVVSFWNLRATTSRLVFIPISNNNRVRDFIQEEIFRAEKIPKNNSGLSRGPVFYFSSDKDINVIEALINSFVHVNPPTFRAVSLHDTISDLDNLPEDYLNWEFSQMNVEIENERVIATINLPEKKFASEDRERGFEKQSLAVFIDAMSFGLNGVFLDPPNIKSLNEFYGREMVFDPWKIRVHKEGFSILIDLDDKYVRLKPIEQGHLIHRIFKDMDIVSEISQAGLLASKIINKLDSVEGARVFKIRGVRDLFEKLKSDNSLSYSASIDIIKQSGGFNKYKGLYIEYREEKELKPEMVFEFLLKKQFLRAGLDLGCKNCNLNNWLNLKDIDDMWVCEYCGNSNLTSTYLRHRGDWKFRKSGLFAKDNNQEGSVPVILTTLFFHRVLHDPFPFTSSLKLKLFGKEIETDFCIVQHKWNRNSQIQIVIGECKSAGGKITNEDADNLKLIVGKLKDRGYKAYITFSKTADDFLVEEIDIFRKLNEEGYSLILLTNKEIEPYYPYESTDIEEKLPHQSVVNLDHVRNNSIARYLKYNSFDLD